MAFNTTAISHWQTLSHNVVSSTPRLSEFELTTLVVMCTDCEPIQDNDNYKPHAKNYSNPSMFNKLSHKQESVMADRPSFNKVCYTLRLQGCFV
jgi:hypothetical protein